MFYYKLFFIEGKIETCLDNDGNFPNSNNDPIIKQLNDLSYKGWELVCWEDRTINLLHGQPNSEFKKFGRIGIFKKYTELLLGVGPERF